MKRLYLTLATALAATLSQADTLDFGYCTDHSSGISHNQADVWLAGAMRIPAGRAAEFEGNQITAVSIGFGQSTPKRVTIFMTYDLQEEPFYTQTANLKVNRFNRVPLTDAYTFEGRDVWIGYKIKTSMATDYPVGWDFCEVAQSEDANWFSSTLDEEEIASSWVQLDPHYGNVCIRAIIEGDNLGGWQQSMRPIDAGLPQFACPGKPFDTTLSVQNTGVQPVSSFQVTTAIDTEQPRTWTVNLAEPLVSGACTVTTLEGMKTDLTGDALPVTVSLTAVNGADNQSQSPSLQRPLLSSPYMARKTMVIEEATGTWCSWCPRGYVALEQMRANHKDGSYIGIAVHDEGGRGFEPMQCDSYVPWKNRYISGFPQATANRITKFSIDPAGAEDLWQVITEMPVEADVAITADYADDNHEYVRANVTVSSLKEIAGHNFGIAMVITEDNVGPYMQANAYAGGGQGQMGGFESLNGYTSLMYNDVARDIFDWEGRTDVLPAVIEANTNYEYCPELPLQNVGDHTQAHIIALLIDTATGQIENAASCYIGTNGVRRQAPEATVKVVASPGMLTVLGDDVDSATVCTPSGTCVATLDGPGSVALPTGLYIVAAKAAGKTTATKVIVK